MSFVGIRRAWIPVIAAALFASMPGYAGKRTRELGAPPVKGAMVLFSGRQDEVTQNWLNGGENGPAGWKVQDGGSMQASGGDIISKERFTDYQLHVEFKVPYMPDKKGQARGNSGVFMQGRYEIQVLDSYGLNEPGTGDCGAVYGKVAPLVNACKPPREWQSYDISFRAPRFDAAGAVTEPARVTVIQNGVVIQNNTVIPGPTWGRNFGALSAPGPIVLQDHGNPVEYRNVWILPLPLKGADHYEGK